MGLLSTNSYFCKNGFIFDVSFSCTNFKIKFKIMNHQMYKNCVPSKSYTNFLFNYFENTTNKFVVMVNPGCYIFPHIMKICLSNYKLHKERIQT